MEPQKTEIQFQRQHENTSTTQQDAHAENNSFQSSSSSNPHRGIIRLPPNSSNQIYPINEQIPHLYHKMQQIDLNAGIRMPINSQNFDSLDSRKQHQLNKPCVAIRPTPHVSSSLHHQPRGIHDNFNRYSPSSSPDAHNTNMMLTQFAPNALISGYNQESYRSLSPPSYSSHYNEFQMHPASSHYLSSHASDADTRIPNLVEIPKKKLKPNVEKNLNEALSAESDLHKYMTQNAVFDQSKVEQSRFRIQLRYEHVILSDLRCCAELNIEQRLWKAAFYQFIEHYRRQMEDFAELETAKTSLLKLVDEATLFFENLIVKMQDTYNFNIDKLLEHEYDREAQNYELLKLASISAQKIYLYLGDLARYKELEMRSSNFGKSRR